MHKCTSAIGEDCLKYEDNRCCKFCEEHCDQYCNPENYSELKKLFGCYEVIAKEK